MKKAKLLAIFLFLSCFMVLVSKNVNAYDMPVGIPEAWIAPDIATKTRPTPWTSEQAGNYYVDNSVTCTDTNNIYGAPGNPRCRFPTTLNAGAYVEIHGGPYNWTSTVYIKSFGTKENPVWFVGQPDDRPDIQMSLVLHGTYLYVENLDLSNNKGISARPYNLVQTDHIMVRNTKITGTGSIPGTSGMGANGDSTRPFVGFIGYNNTISYLGDYVAEVENDHHALYTGSYISDVWFLDNLTHHNGGDGVQFSHGGVEAHHFYYGRNISHNERENCVDIKQANDVIISENICHSIRPVSSSDGACMVVHYDPSRIWFINNTIYDCNTAIVTSGSMDTFVVGNLIYDISEYSTETHGDISLFRSGSAIRAYNSGDMYVANNTIYSSVLGVSYSALAGYKCDITGNVFSSFIPGEFTSNNAYAIMMSGDNTAVLNSNIENNIFHNPMRLHIDGTTYTSLSNLQTEELKCDDNGGSCFDSDPLFTDIVNNNFYLQATSPAIDKGALSNVYETFNNTYGLDIKKDIEGNTRPTGDAWDIGAFEYHVQIRGDVDNSGTINTTDALLTLRNSLGLSMDSTAWYISVTTGDVNNDSNSNSTDALLILRYSLGLDMTETSWFE